MFEHRVFLGPRRNPIMGRWDFEGMTSRGRWARLQLPSRGGHNVCHGLRLVGNSGQTRPSQKGAGCLWGLCDNGGQLLRREAACMYEFAGSGVTRGYEDATRVPATCVPRGQTARADAAGFGLC